MQHSLKFGGTNYNFKWVTVSILPLIERPFNTKKYFLFGSLTSPDNTILLNKMLTNVQ